MKEKIDLIHYTELEKSNLFVMESKELIKSSTDEQSRAGCLSKFEDNSAFSC